MEYRLTFEKFRKALDEGWFPALRCRECQAVTTPPKMVCRKCQSPDLDIVALSGNAQILTYTVIRVAAEGMEPPFVVALAKTDEGPLLMGNVENVNPDTVEMDALMDKKVLLGYKPVKADRFSGGEQLALTFTLLD